MQFYIDHLSTIDAMGSFVERCNYIQELVNDGYPFHLEDQPEAWIQRLVLMDYAIPLVVLNYIDQLFGRNAICMEASLMYEYPIHIIDSLRMLMHVIRDSHLDNRTHIENNIFHVILLLHTS